MIVLRPTRLHWLDENGQDPADLCAHSPVELSVDGIMLVAPDAGDWTVSAAALYLLRTLSKPHTAASRVGDQLFPCCGFTMYAVGEPDVVVVGCLSGADLEVVRDGEIVKLMRPDGAVFGVSFLDWRQAVCQFSDAVQAFYDSSIKRVPGSREDQNGFRAFKTEWERRRTLASSLA